MECDVEYQEERDIPAHGKSVEYIFLHTCTCTSFCLSILPSHRAVWQLIATEQNFLLSLCDFAIQRGYPQLWNSVRNLLKLLPSGKPLCALCTVHFLYMYMYMLGRKHARDLVGCPLQSQYSADSRTIPLNVLDSA